MTVSELIERLEEFDVDLEVVFECSDDMEEGEQEEIDIVESNVRGTRVILR